MGWFAAAAVAALVVAGSARTTTTFQRSDLGTLGGATSNGNAVSASGQVVGISDAGDGTSPAFSWTATGGMVPIGTLGGGFGSAAAVNDSGQAVGFSATSAGPFHAFSWTRDGGIVDLGTFAGAFSLAHAINTLGEVVGKADTDTGQTHAFRWTSTADGLHDLGTLGGTFSDAWAVNDDGMVVGDSLTVNNAQDHAVAWSANDQITDLGTLGGVFTKSNAFAVNSGGEVVGYSAQPPTSIRHAFAWNAIGGMIDLGLLPGGGYSEAIAVNDNYQIAGTATDANGVEHAVFWPSPNANIADLGPGHVFGLNNNGEVVGINGGNAFVWTQTDGRIDLGSGTAAAVNDNGQIAGTSGSHAALWQPQGPTAPSAPTNVVAAASDGSASVSWVAATANGSPITSYTVIPDPFASTVTVDGSTTTGTVTGLTDGTPYTFTVIAASGTQGGPASAPSNQVTPQAGAPPAAAASGSASTSSPTTVSTGSDPAATGGTSTSLTVPADTSGGAVSVIQSGTSEPSPSGYLLGGIQIDITAPAATAANPLVLVFTFAPAAGQTPDNAEIYRAEGTGTPTLVADCSGPSSQAVPDPCVSARQSVTVAGSTYIQLTVLASTASHWNTARPKAGAVTVGDNGYSPQSLTVQPGATVSWTFAGKKVHSATDSALLGSVATPWFDSGRKSSASYSFAFPAAGGFRYSSTAKNDSFSGTVLVPDLVTPSGGGTASTYAIGWSTKTLPGYVFDVQYRYRPAKATGWKGWVNWKPGTTTTTATFVPTQGAGTYAFHSRLRNTATGRASDYSPDTTLTAS